MLSSVHEARSLCMPGADSGKILEKPVLGEMSMSKIQSRPADSQGWQLASLSSGLDKVATDVNKGKLAKASIRSALHCCGSRVRARAKMTVRVPKTVVTTRMVRVAVQKKIRVPTTRRVPDMRNAGRLSKKGNTVTTPGGYKVRMQGTTAYITAPNGKQIKVWGDPHISSSNGRGGKQNIDFRKGTTTFMLPDGTRITMKAYNGRGKLAANGLLGKLEIYNGSKHVTMSNGRGGTGRTGRTRSSGIKSDGWAHAARTSKGDVLDVVGNGAQLAYRGRLTKHESVSGRVRSGSWRTGARVGKGRVGARALHVPTKTIRGFKTATVTEFKTKLVKEFKTVWENKQIPIRDSNDWIGAGGTPSFDERGPALNTDFQASATGTAFDCHEGRGAFGSDSNDWGNSTLGDVGGAFGGISLYGEFDFNPTPQRETLKATDSNGWGSAGLAGSAADYIGSATSGAHEVFVSYNVSIEALSTY